LDICDEHLAITSWFYVKKHDMTDKIFQWLAPFGDPGPGCPLPHTDASMVGVLEPSMWQNIHQQAQNKEKMQQKKQ